MSSGQGVTTPLDVPASTPPTSSERQDIASQDAIVRHAVGVERVLRLVEALAPLRSRNETLSTLVQFLASEFPRCHIRCGIGHQSVHRLIDARLGWLPPTSELFQEEVQAWETDATENSGKRDIERAERFGDQSEPAHASDEVILDLSDDSTPGRCRLTLRGGTITPEDHQWLSRAATSVKVLLWRPENSMLAKAFYALSDTGLTTRVYIGLCCLAILLLSVWPVSYRVRCTTVVRPVNSRVISAPFAATLQSVEAEPGDHVRKGDVLFELDGRPLRLELESINAQIGHARKEGDIALVGGRVAEAQQAELKVRELSRRRDLIERRLGQLVVTSPMNGIVVAGELIRSIGSPLETGKSIMEIASLDSMRVELEIPEYDVGYVHKGRETRIRFAAIEGEAFDTKLGDVYPSSELRDDQNVFIAPVRLGNDANQLRPGMRGEAVVYGPVRPWLWSFARRGWEKLVWWVGY